MPMSNLIGYTEAVSLIITGQRKEQISLFRITSTLNILIFWSKRQKQEGGLRRGTAGEPVRISLTILFWYSTVLIYPLIG